MNSLSFLSIENKDIVWLSDYQCEKKATYPPTLKNLGQSTSNIKYYLYWPNNVCHGKLSEDGNGFILIFDPVRGP